MAQASNPLIIDRYAIYDEIAAGGMATVHLARLVGPAGFSRTVAVKRLHRHLTSDQDFPTMLIDEARVAARIRHPNVVSTLDVVATRQELLLVMEYIHGESVARLARTVQARGQLIPLRITGAILIDALHGLHAAHEATDPQGAPLGIVHRDISPQNLLVGVDGITRVADFGIAKAAGRAHVTRDASIKGKLAYMAPEQIQQGEVTRTTDVFAACVVLWELLTGHLLLAGRTDAQTIHNVLNAEIPPPSVVVPTLPRRLDEILRRGLARDPDARYQTARELALDLEACFHPIRPSEIGAWVERTASDALAQRARLIADVEGHTPMTDVALAPTVSTSAAGLQGKADEATTDAEERAPGTRRVPMSAAPPPRQTAATDPLYQTSRVNAVHVLASDQWPAPPKRRIWPTALIGLAVVAGGAALVGTRQHRASLLLVPTASSPQASAAADLSSALAPPGMGAALPAPKSSAEMPAASPAVSSKPQASGATTPHAPRRKPQCDPPYTIDSSGRRIFKLECM
jgi:serine/threonine-protein kinase